MFDNSNQRKYVCFCCGVAFEDFVDYKNHIIENHEEGREYIVCPVPHCKAPVRDLRAHFTVIHKHLPIPKTGMLKAIVWKDFSPKNKKKTRKPKFREGYYQSSKMNKPIHYRSGYECTIYECLDADVDVTAYEAEPFEIPYIHKGKAHRYKPDIIVKFLDGHTEVWEVKPSSQTTLEKNQDKWYSASEACKTRGWEFKVITELGIDKLKMKVKNQKFY